MKFFLFITLLLSFVTVGCGPTSLAQYNETELQKAREHWVGETENTLITSWGPPNSKTVDSNGNKIFVYRRNNGYITWITNFYIDSAGKVWHLNAHSE